MAEEFEVRGAHEDAVDHHAEHGEPLAQKIALFSAILATLGAVVSLLGGHTEHDALYYKNEAVLLKARASDQWSYYQAEEVKRHIYLATGGNDPAAVKRAADYATKSAALRNQAEALDRQSEAADAESGHAMRPHLKLSIAMTFLQIAIALASITALTRRRWLFGAAGLAAAGGVLLATLAWL
ncbi:MAG: DUF4337 domain-containing protein [Sphingomonas sp.]|uniref:DUF4337 domain-containing protein n=1 Tax=Sphingomonas sp. TaxID=28214 RepID=UPI001ACC880E|nr:DUF4337 domain-containing protein [Sphingomonas sp.]MBN8807544.1 DUF4337 domain-containing protein [Sphingomonas sp.]